MKQTNIAATENVTYIYICTSWCACTSCRHSLVQELHHQEHLNNERSGCQKWNSSGGRGLGWKGELFPAQWAHETCPEGHPGRDATHRWALDQGVDLTIEAITLMNVKIDIMKWVKWLKPPWNRRWWLGYQWGGPVDWLNHTTEANLPSRQVLCASCSGGEIADSSKCSLQPVTTQNAILDLEKQVVTQHHLHLRHCYLFQHL